jgi:peptide/nickel transport system substrate-binding protein
MMATGSSSRRQFVRYCLLVIVGGSQLLAACSAAPAQPTAAPPQPTAAPPKPTAAAQPTSAPAQPTSAPAAKPTSALPQATTAPAAAAPQSAASAAMVTIAAANDIESADPHTNQALVYNNVIRLSVFNALVRYGPNLEYVPDLAEKWENPDDKTYIFHLRQGAKYHNGQEVEASHVEYSFKRIADKKAVFASRVAGIDAYQVVDKYTIKLTLKTPQADFIDGLVLLSIVPPEVDADLEKKPIGSGPFQFVEWVPNDHITLQRFPGYFEKDVAKVDKLVFKIIPDPQVAITNLQAGAIDGILDLPLAQASTFKSSTAVKAVIQSTSSIHIIELMGKNSEPIRSSAKVRQALAMCLDKDAVQKIAFAGEGRQKWSWVPYGTWAYKQEEGYPFDPQKAKALLADAGYPNGFTFSINLLNGYPEGEKIATIWQAGLQQAGVTLNLQTMERAVWSPAYRGHDFDVSWNVFPGFADPNYFVAFDLKVHLADQWKNTDAAQLADQAATTLDQAKRTELYGRLQDIFVSDVPVIVTQEVPAASLTKPNVSGWQINALGHVIVRGVSVG